MEFIFYATITVSAWLVLVSIILLYQYVRNKIRLKNLKRAKELQQFEDETSDAEDEGNKEEFKKTILLDLKHQMEVKKSTLEDDILKLTLKSEDFKHEQMRKNIITQVAQEVFFDFKKRFFNEVSRVVTEQNKKKRIKNERPNRHQEKAVKELEEKIYKSDDERQLTEIQKQTVERQTIDNIKQDIEKNQKRMVDEVVKREEELRNIKEQQQKEQLEKDAQKTPAQLIPNQNSDGR